MTTIARQLVAEAKDDSVRWRRAALQPIVNFGFFSKLYRKHRPRFATFHSNHVAHYQHTYWKAMEPDKFRPIETTETERRAYGGAIEYGYTVADRLLADTLKLVDDNTVLIVASSLGQKPYLSKLKGGKQIQQLRSHKRLMDILGVDKSARVAPAMSDEFTIYADEPDLLEQIAKSLGAAWVGEPQRKMFGIQLRDNAVRVNIRVYDAGDVKSDSPICFPLEPNSPKFPYEDLMYNTGHLKSGCHDPRGMAIFYGKGITPGTQLGDYNNLDFAPTFLKMLELPVQPEMPGRVMHEVA
jgi:arylsulfatase A-like enzyme